MSNDSVQRKDRRGDADPEEKPHGDGGRDGRDVANSLGTPRTPEAGRGGKAPPWSLCREHSPRTPGPWPSGVQDGDRMDSWAFSHLVCYGNPRKLTQRVHLCVYVSDVTPLDCFLQKGPFPYFSHIKLGIRTISIFEKHLEFKNKVCFSHLSGPWRMSWAHMIEEIR